MIIPNNITRERLISLLLFSKTVDYLELTDFDTIDWMEWAKLHQN